jgi:hypothetical protein
VPAPGNNFNMAWEEKVKIGVVEQVQFHCIDREISLAGVQRIFFEADQVRLVYARAPSDPTLCL